MIKNKKIIIFIVGAIVIMITISGIITYNMFKSQFSNANNMTNTEKQMVENATKDMTEDEKQNVDSDTAVKAQMSQTYMRYETAYKFGDKQLPECPKEVSDTIYKNYCILAQTADFKTIISNIEEEKKRYKFYEDYNWKIGDIYLDSNVILSTQDDDISNSQKSYMIKNLKDPNMLLIGALMMPEKAKRTIFPDANSLAPIFSGGVSIKDTEIIKMKDIKDVQNIKDFTLRTIVEKDESDIISVHKISFQIEGHSLVGYLMEYDSGSYSLYSIQKDESAKNDNIPYKTIAYLIEMEGNSNK